MMWSQLRAVGAVVFASASIASAQVVSGEIEGRVTDASGQPLGGVRVLATGRTAPGTRVATTTADGHYRITAVPAGSHDVRITRIGATPIIVERVTVSLGRSTSLGSIQMPSLAQRLEPLRISASVLSLDPRHTDVGATINASEYSQLPGHGDFKSMISILPHVVESFRGDPLNVGGATGFENAYFIDGVNVTDPLKGRTGTVLPRNFIREVEVKTGGYEARYGRALGAIVNAVTHSGTNTFEINAFAFGTHGAFTAEAKAEPTLKETDRLAIDAGIRIGGPLIRDRIWYSAAYNPRVERSTHEIGSLGLYDDRRTTHLFAGKLNWQASERHTVELALFGDPWSRKSVEAPYAAPVGYQPLNPDPYLLQRDGGGLVASIASRNTITDRIRLETALMHSAVRENELGAGRDEILYVDDVERTISGGAWQTDRARHERTAFRAVATMELPGHDIVAGAEYEDALSAGVHHYAGIYRTDQSAYRWQILGEPGRNTFHNRVPTAYVQDSWRLTNALRLNLGVRWSRQTFSSATQSTGQRFEDEWQPRLGFVWLPGSRREHRVFGSWGRFYVQQSVNVPAGWYLDFFLADKYYSIDPRTAGATPDSVNSYIDSASNYTGAPDLSAEHVDEYTIGYERLLNQVTKLTLRGMRRSLRSSYQVAYGPDGKAAIGTAGEGKLSFLPRARRNYAALEVGLEGTWKSAAYRASYVLSRNRGNYPGLYDADYGFPTPGLIQTLMFPYQADNSSGLLPNDRRHVFKLSGSRDWRWSLSTGAMLSIASGTPLNIFAAGPDPYSWAYRFTVPRGSAGRTSATWNLDLRIARSVSAFGGKHRVLLDLVNVGNPQKPVWLDELKFPDNASSDTSPTYGIPRAFQPPMFARLGVELTR